MSSEAVESSPGLCKLDRGGLEPSAIAIYEEVLHSILPLIHSSHITLCSTFIEETCFSETFTHGTLSAIIFVFIHFHETIFWGCTLKCFWGRRLGRPNNSQPIQPPPPPLPHHRPAMASTSSSTTKRSYQPVCRCTQSAGLLLCEDWG